jgi:tetratricopeptide (TPR) repeat protein
MKTKLFIILIVLVAVVCSLYFIQMKGLHVKNGATKSAQRDNEIPTLLVRNLKSGPEGENEKFIRKWSILSNSVKENPANFKARLELAELYIAEARITGEHPYYYTAALKMINSVLSRDPKDRNLLFYALSLKASVQLSLHRFAEGLRTAEEAVAINPHNSAIYGALVDANVELGNYDEAVKMADKMVAIRPDLRSYSRVSYLREIFGDVKGAIDAMDMAVKAGFPGNESTSWARFTLGRIYENYGNQAYAEMQYQIALMERPDYPFALEGLAGIEMNKGNMKKAEDLLKKAAGLIPEISFHVSMAKLYLKTGQKARADIETDTVLKMMAEDEKSGHKVDLEKAKIYLELIGDPEKALSLALNEHKIRPRNIDVNLVAVRALIALERYAEAEKYLAVASSTHSKNPELLKCKGIVEANLGKQDKLGYRY